MKIHYFYRKEYHKGFYQIELVAWLEEKEISRQGCERLSFTQLEKLDIFLSKDNESFHCHRIVHDFGEKSCLGHYAHTRSDLIRDMERQSMLPVDGRNYERFRKVALQLYIKQPLVDFSKFAGKQDYTIRQIWGE